jgi:hypothetical protein
MKSQLDYISLGPITTDHILAMAALTRDFHPISVVPDVAARYGYRGTVLHSIWISGLVGIGIRRYVPHEFRVDVELAYHEAALQGTTLVLTMRFEDHEAVVEGLAIGFEVRDGRRKLVASGKVVIKNPVSGTSGR